MRLVKGQVWVDPSGYTRTITRVTKVNVTYEGDSRLPYVESTRRIEDFVYDSKRFRWIVKTP